MRFKSFLLLFFWVLKSIKRVDCGSIYEICNLQNNQSIKILMDVRIRRVYLCGSYSWELNLLIKCNWFKSYLQLARFRSSDQIKKVSGFWSVSYIAGGFIKGVFFIVFSVPGKIIPCFFCLLIHLSCFGAFVLLIDLQFFFLFVNFVKLKFSRNLKGRKAFICNVPLSKYLVETIELHVLLYYCY